MNASDEEQPSSRDFLASELRQVIVYTLAQMSEPSPDVAAALIRLLKDPEYPVRREATNALADLALSSSEVASVAVPALLGMLQDSMPGIRWRAAMALGEIGSPEALGSLLALSEAEKASWREGAALALGEVGASSTQMAAAAVPALRNLLTDPDILVRWASASALSRLSAPITVGELQTLLREETEYGLHGFRYGSEELVEAKADALGHLGASSAKLAAVALPILIDCLEYEHPFVRSAAADALKRIGPAAGEAGPALVARLKDRNEAVRHAAANALVQIGSPETVPALLSLLEQVSDTDEA